MLDRRETKLLYAIASHRRRKMHHSSDGMIKNKASLKQTIIGLYMRDLKIINSRKLQKIIINVIYKSKQAFKMLKLSFRQDAKFRLEADTLENKSKESYNY